MPARFRLSRADLTHLAKGRARRVQGTYMFCLVYPLSEAMRGPKATYVASKKVSPKATERNSVERKLRHIAATLLPTARRDRAYVFQAKKEAMKATPTELTSDMRGVFERAGA